MATMDQVEHFTRNIEGKVQTRSSARHLRRKRLNEARREKGTLSSTDDTINKTIEICAKDEKSETLTKSKIRRLKKKQQKTKSSRDSCCNADSACPYNAYPYEYENAADDSVAYDKSGENLVNLRYDADIRKVETVSNLGQQDNLDNPIVTRNANSAGIVDNRMDGRGTEISVIARQYRRKCKEGNSNRTDSKSFSTESEVDSVDSPHSPSFPISPSSCDDRVRASNKKYDTVLKSLNVKSRNTATEFNAKNPLGNSLDSAACSLNDEKQVAVNSEPADTILLDSNPQECKLDYPNEDVEGNRLRTPIEEIKPEVGDTRLSDTNTGRTEESSVNISSGETATGTVVGNTRDFADAAIVRVSEERTVTRASTSTNDILEEDNTKKEMSPEKVTDDGMINKGKTREEIRAEREAKKAAKAATKAAKSKGGETGKMGEEEAKEKTAGVERTSSKSNEGGSNEGKSNEGKSKAELRAERRAKQEAQRAAKQKQQNQQQPQGSAKDKEARANKVASKEATPPSIDRTSETTKMPTKKITIVKENPHEVNLFKHLYDERELALTSVPSVNSKIHPAIIRLGVQYASRTIVGSNARCVALLAAVKHLLQDFQRSTQTDFVRGLEASLQECTTYLHHCRPLAVSMQNALRHIKWQMTQLPSTVSDEDAKNTLQTAIDTYISEQIQLADKAISLRIQTKISDGNVILTYGYSSLINKILLDARTAGKQFRVIVVDGRPWLEGREQLRRLTKHGIECSYVLINALSYIMPEVSKVFLGAHAILANGAVMARVGTAQVALMARAFNIPVLVACETHKSSERVQTDSIVYNELGDADELTRNFLSNSRKSTLANWRTRKCLNLLNIAYDVTPADLVTAVVTELAILPCTSVPVILRIKPSEA